MCLQHYEAEFIELACQCPTVVCCRCSPTHKATVVQLLKTYTRKPVCAIGNQLVLVSVIPFSGTLSLYLSPSPIPIPSPSSSPPLFLSLTFLSHSPFHSFLFHLPLIPSPSSSPTLSGDGGNDVSMIQAANAGIGIAGKVSHRLIPFTCTYTCSCIGRITGIIGC